MAAGTTREGGQLVSTATQSTEHDEVPDTGSPHRIVTDVALKAVIWKNDPTAEPELVRGGLTNTLGVPANGTGNVTTSVVTVLPEMLAVYVPL